MLVLGKVWKDRSGLTLEFLIKTKRGEMKTNSIKLVRCNKRFNLLRLFFEFAVKIVDSSDKDPEVMCLMWEREFEVEDEIIKRKFKAAVES